MASSATLESLQAGWNQFSFRDISIRMQQLGSMSSEKVNTILLSTVSQPDAKVAAASLRLILALHYQLGKRAEFHLNDRVFATLLSIVERSVVSTTASSSTNNSSAFGLLSDLCVALLALNTATASATVGIENQLCALFLTASPEHQRLLLPLVHRSFYNQLRSSSLSADAFNAMIRRQAREANTYHEFLRLFALVHSRAEVLEDFAATELRGTSPIGPKPMFGSAPVAVGLDGQKCHNSRLAPSAGSHVAKTSTLRDSFVAGGASASSAAAAYYTVCHFLESPTPGQVQHSYLLSALSHAIRRSLSIEHGPHPLVLSSSACEEIAGYLEDVFGQVASLMQSKKWPLYSGKKGLGLQFIEGVLSDALFIAKWVCLWHRGTAVADDIEGVVTDFLYSAMRVVRVVTRKTQSECEAPEIADSDAYASVCQANAAPHDAVTLPLFCPDVMLQCLEFHIAVSPLPDVLNMFDDVFSSSIWDAYLAHYESFPLEFCRVLERHRARLRSILPSFAPRVIWLLSQQPHVLFPVVKRLLLPMTSEATGLDIFFRIVFLPLICFSTSFNPPNPDDDASGDVADDAHEESNRGHGDRSRIDSVRREDHDFYRDLWLAITDWRVHDQSGQMTPFAEFCIINARCFTKWDALHRSMGAFDSTMTVAYRLIRPLLTEYFKATEKLPPQIFSAIRMAYFFLISPQDQRHVVTDFLLDMGRFVSELRPDLVQASTGCFLEMLQQESIPSSKRSWRLQRWAALVAAAGLAKRVDDEASAREAAVYFEALHVTVWELVALASTAVSIQYQASLTPTGSTERDVSSAPYRRGLPSQQFAITPLATSSLDDLLSSSAPLEGGLAADYLPETHATGAHKVVWSDSRCPLLVYVTPSVPVAQDMSGIHFTEHMSSLVMALSLLSQICPNVKERGMICLANLIRTLMKSRHSGAQLATTATVCLKMLQFPTMNGLSTMPLHALLGLQVLHEPRSRASGTTQKGAPTV